MIYRFIAVVLFSCCSLLAQSFNGLPASTPYKSAVVIPADLPCRSLYDRFYSTEPGVTAYYAGCKISFPQLDDSANDSVGTLGLINTAYGVPAIIGVPGPVPDGELATQTPDANNKAENDGTLVSTYGGAVVMWLNADATNYAVSAWQFLPQPAGSGKQSRVALGIVNNGTLCFNGTWTSSTGVSASVQQCGYTPNTWHRVGINWDGSTFSLYIDGTLKSHSAITGTLDLAQFYRQVFPGCCVTGKQMSVAKIVVTDQSWSAAQFAADYAPNLAAINPPAGGVAVTAQPEGTIHADVLGVAFEHPQAAFYPALLKGLTAAHIKAVRYFPGGTGILSDMNDWHPGALVGCNRTQPVVAVNAPASTPGATLGNFSSLGVGDTEDNAFTQIFQPLGIDVIHSVNWGSNPPLCNNGGDPQTNAGDLVTYLNVTHNYNVQRFEIGNEQWANSSNVDLHPSSAAFLNGYEGMSAFPLTEPAFYAKIKAVAPNSMVYVPLLAGGPQGLADNYIMPLLATGAFEGPAAHGYSIHNPISDTYALYPDRPDSDSLLRNYLRQFDTLNKMVGKVPHTAFTEHGCAVSGGPWSVFCMSAAAALYETMQLAEAMFVGVDSATMWAQGNGSSVSSDNVDYGIDPGHIWSWSHLPLQAASDALVYTAEHGITNDYGPAIGMQPGDLYPSGHAYELLGKSGFVTEGEHSLLSFADPAAAPWLAAYGATHGAGFAVILVNRDLAPHTVPVSIAGMASCATAVTWSYGRAQYDRTLFGDWSAGVDSSAAPCVSGAVQQVALPAFSANVVVFQ